MHNSFGFPCTLYFSATRTPCTTLLFILLQLVCRSWSILRASLFHSIFYSFPSILTQLWRTLTCGVWVWVCRVHSLFSFAYAKAFTSTVNFFGSRAHTYSYCVSSVCVWISRKNSKEKTDNKVFSVHLFDTFFSGIALFIHFYSNFKWMHGLEMVRDF